MAESQRIHVKVIGRWVITLFYFYSSLTVSVVALAIIISYVRFQRNGWDAAAHIGIITIIAAAACTPAVALQFISVEMLVLGLYRWKWRHKTFVIAAISASVLAYAIAFLDGYYELNSYQERRERYAQEFLVERLPPVEKSTLGKHPKAIVEDRLQELEKEIGSTSFDGVMRERALMNLHNRRMESFVKSSGFGVGRLRIFAVPTEENVRPPEMAAPLLQPAITDEMHSSDSTITHEPADTADRGLTKLHFGGVIDFVNPRGFGYLTPENQLFGFQPHHFRKVPKTDAWQVRTLELVSLLLHDEPKVYVTKYLPSMEAVRNIPTRSLDHFETTGLAKLQAGEDLFARETAAGMRMLGAVRSVEQCLKCHGGERGDLLGAFSYKLARLPGK
jgi:hypothetical protein